MKKITLIILALFIVTTGAAFAASIQAIDNSAWLDHTAKMQVLRENILTLVSKELPTATDKAELASLMQLFTAEKKQWSNYIEQVAKAPQISVAKSECKSTCKSIKREYRKKRCRSSRKFNTSRECKQETGYRNSKCHSKLIGKCPKCDGSCTKAIARKTSCKTVSKNDCKTRKHGYRNNKCNSELIGNCPNCDGSCKQAKACDTDSKSPCKVKKHVCKSNCQ